MTAPNSFGDTAPANSPVVLLQFDEPVFWPTQRTGQPGQWTYSFETPGGAGRLRVALSGPLSATRPTHRLNLASPTDEHFASDFPSVSQEVFVTDPPRGSWTITVTKDHSGGSNFRLRALLESRVKERGVLPNLRVRPPFDLHQHLPTSKHQSCWAEEAADTCLRFSIAVENIGRAALSLVLQARDEEAHGVVVQRVPKSDGSYSEHQAGTYAFHSSHNHYHLSEFLVFRLTRVGRSVSQGRKVGFCFSNFAMTAWRRFIQRPLGSAISNCRASDGQMDLAPGWLDLYDWRLIDSYVPITPVPKTSYVLRAAIDPRSEYIESRENDNISYTVFKVLKTGAPQILEQGYGKGPNDPAKVVTAGS